MIHNCSLMKRETKAPLQGRVYAITASNAEANPNVIQYMNLVPKKLAKVFTNPSFTYSFVLHIFTSRLSVMRISLESILMISHSSRLTYI